MSELYAVGWHVRGRPRQWVWSVSPSLGLAGRQLAEGLERRIDRTDAGAEDRGSGVPVPREWPSVAVRPGVLDESSAVAARTACRWTACPPEGITTIGQGVVIKGDVKGGEDLAVDGQVDGTIRVPQHVLTVGPTGRVKAQLSAKSVVVLGKVEGRIQANELVRIGETGSVEGAISASRLVVADGARLRGRVDV